jgi:ABC-type nitrate/sulfonate/bicarbonate transport system permease component
VATRSLQAEGSFDISTVMAGILVLTAFALLLDAAVGQVERRLMKWQPKRGRRRSCDGASARGTLGGAL